MGGKVKGWLKTAGKIRLAYIGILPQRFERIAISEMWDSMAPWVHDTWGRRPYDPKLPDLIKRYHVQSILDVGCGSGWLFPMYIDLQLRDVIGVDISEVALAIAKQEYPDITTICCRFEDMVLQPNRFDLAISESSLHHVPRRNIK
jgi:ubiquinone/menaquinone biosynthesis C-methylase UbiE